MNTNTLGAAMACMDGEPTKEGYALVVGRVVPATGAWKPDTAAGEMVRLHGLAARQADEAGKRHEALRTVAQQVLRDMKAQGVLLEWHTLLDEALKV